MTVIPLFAIYNSLKGSVMQTKIDQMTGDVK